VTSVVVALAAASLAVLLGLAVRARSRPAV
jgi:hypothetical protein